MQPIRYRIWQWGPQTGGGASEQYLVGIATRAKRTTPTEPFAVCNEWICWRLANWLGLPVAGAAILERDSEPYFASLDFNIAGHNLPPANAPLLAAEQPEIACAIVLFDIWMANDDRHAGNLHYDTTAKRVYVFDHNRALFACRGMARLDALANTLGIGNHCLAPELISFAALWPCTLRIKQIPDWAIKQAVTEATHIGFPIADTQRCIEFLIYRQTRILSLVEANRAIFTKVPKGMWDTPDSDVTYDI